MGTIADKLTYLGQTKAEIRDAIIAKGVTIPDKMAFREYAGKIREISADGTISRDLTDFSGIFSKGHFVWNRYSFCDNRIPNFSFRLS